MNELTKYFLFVYFSSKICNRLSQVYRFNSRHLQSLAFFAKKPGVCKRLCNELTIQIQLE